MANTTNFGWETPDDTDLVKDGAAAMRTLGNAIDTSFVDLKGGTTGQILSKASNTDLDYTWVSPNPGDITGVTAGTGISGGGTSGDVTITNSMATAIDAKGDLIAGTGADAFSRLAVGSNNQVLTADSSTATGLKWASPAATGFFKNPVLNSNFSVWQRGTSISFTAAGNAYTADRWQYKIDLNTQQSTVSRQNTSDTTNLPNIQYCIRVQRNSGQTGTGNTYFGTSIESINSIPFAGKTITLSFYARAGANYSPTSSVLQVYMPQGTGTDQNCITTGFTGQSNVIAQNATLTTTWQRFSYTGTVNTASTQLGLLFQANNTGTAGTNDYYEITGVQIEVGSSATDYYPNGNTYQAELAACQRYYYNHITSAAAGKAVGMGYYQTASQVRVYVGFPVTMRTTPTLSAATGTGYYQVVVNGAADTFNSFTINAAGETGSEIYNGSEVSGTVGQAAVCEANNASSSISFSAEL